MKKVFQGIACTLACWNFAVIAADMTTTATPAVSSTKVTKEQYGSQKDTIEATYKTERARCDGLTGNAKDVCVEEAKATEKQAKAKLEADYKGDARHQRDYQKTVADTNYEVAKEKCDELAGNAKDICVKEAKQMHAKKLAEIK